MAAIQKKKTALNVPKDYFRIDIAALRMIAAHAALSVKGVFSLSDEKNVHWQGDGKEDVSFAVKLKKKSRNSSV